MSARRAWMVTVPVVLLLGMASGWLSGSGAGNPWFDGLEKPWFMPPGWLFPVAWTILYVLMGVAVARVIERGAAQGARAIGWFCLQLALNLAWSPLFFGLHQARGGLALIVTLLAAVAATIAAFARRDRLAALLLLPYAGWLLLATALNAAIVTLNP